MATLFQFPKTSFERDRVTLFRTPVPGWNSARVKRTAQHFAARGKVEDAGARLLMRSKVAVLEIFLTSDSVWWTNLSAKSEEPLVEKDQLTDDKAIGLADDYLKTHGLKDDRARVRAVTFTELSVVRRRQKQPATARTAVQVNYDFSLEGLPVLGPGAKIQVTLGRKNAVIEALKFWREPVAEKETRLIPLETAMNLLREDETFADLKANESQVVFHRVELGYYALPPRETQGFLIPVYAFHGTISTRHLERYDFVKKVVAVTISPEEAKQTVSVGRAMMPVF